MEAYPRGMYFEDFEAGQEFVTLGRTITESDVLGFAGLSGDFNPLHLDHEFAQKSPFKARIPHGLCIMSIASGLIDRTGVNSGTALACLEITWKFLASPNPRPPQTMISASSSLIFSVRSLSKSSSFVFEVTDSLLKSTLIIFP